MRSGPIKPKDVVPLIPNRNQELFGASAPTSDGADLRRRLQLERENALLSGIMAELQLEILRLRRLLKR
jgi:hypothetical protein